MPLKRQLDGLTLEQRLFVAEYMIDRDAAAAAERAGLGRDRGAVLLGHVRIRAAIELRTEAMATRIEQVKAQDVVREAARLAFSELRGVFHPETGALLEPKDWPDDVARTVASLDVTTSRKGAGQVSHVNRIRSWDKTKALELLAKIFGMVSERHHHTHEVTLLSLAQPEILLEMSDQEIKVLDGVIKRVYGKKQAKRAGAGRAPALPPAVT